MASLFSNFFTLACIIAVIFAPPVRSVAVMSVDLGSEWMKIAVVSPGVPMEIVLNKESKRKTPVAVAFRDGERVFGEDAINVGSRFPKQCYVYLLEVLGKTPDNPLVKKYMERFPQYEIVADPETGLAVFQHDENTIYSPEELIAMILNKAREYAEEFADQKPIKDVVITVPAFFTQVERRAMLRAADLAELKVLQLINDNAAAALNYGIFRRKEFNETPQRILFFDMGASSTVATVASYQIVKTKERGFVESNPQVSIIGIGYDRTLGGLEMQMRLRDHLGRAFNDQKKTVNDVFKNPRSMQKLFKEAGRLKNVLSANSEHISQVEGLLDEQDFRLIVNRDEFEKMCEDLFARVAKPLEMAITSAGLSYDLIDQVILVGAGTRVPKVQEKVQEVVKKELGKSLNTDEAAAMGAVYRAADHSVAFNVKKFLVKDVVLYPVQVDYTREVVNEDGSKGQKIVKSALFGAMNSYPQKKVMSFRKHTDDFVFNVNYGDLSHLPREDLQNLGSLNLTEVRVSGVAGAIGKHAGKEANVETKGVKAHFVLDESGVIRVTAAEFVFEKTEEKKAQPADESPLSRLGSTISSFFGAGSKEKEEAPVEEVPTGEGEAGATSSTTEAPKKEEDKTKENVTSPGNDTKADEAKNATSDGKPVITTIKEPLIVAEKKLDAAEPTPEALAQRIEHLAALNKIDRARADREASRNALESFALDVQDKFYQEEFEKATTEEERTAILADCSAVTDWLYEDGFEAEGKEFKKRLSELKDKTKDIFDRVNEHRHRQEFLDFLDNSLETAKNFSAQAKNMEEGIFTSVEIETLDKLIAETYKWKATKVSEQKETPLTSKPVLTGFMINEKVQALDREIKYMVNKGKINAARKAEENAKKAAEAAKKDADENKTSSGDAADKEPSASGDKEPPFKLPDFDPSKMTPEQLQLLKDLMQERLKENPESAKFYENLMKNAMRPEDILNFGDTLTKGQEGKKEAPSPSPTEEEVLKTKSAEETPEVPHSEL